MNNNNTLYLAAMTNQSPAFQLFDEPRDLQELAFHHAAHVSGAEVSGVVVKHLVVDGLAFSGKKYYNRCFATIGDVSHQKKLNTANVISVCVQ